MKIRLTKDSMLTAMQATLYGQAEQDCLESDEGEALHAAWTQLRDSKTQFVDVILDLDGTLAWEDVIQC